MKTLEEAALAVDELFNSAFQGAGKVSASILMKILDLSLVATDGSGDDSEDEEERRDEEGRDEEDAETEDLGDLDSPVCDLSLLGVCCDLRAI